MVMDENIGAMIQRVPSGAEATLLTMPGQVIAKTLTSGEIEVGLRCDRLTRFPYLTEKVIVCRSNEEEWVRWLHPMTMLFVPIPQHTLAIAAEESGCTNNVVATPDLTDPRVLSLLNAIQADIETGSSAGELFLESTYLALASVLLDNGHKVRKAALKGGLTPRQLARVRDFMKDNLATEVRLESLANLLDISQGHFGQMFRHSMGISPHNYLLRLRLEHARHLLVLGRSGILEIALACGFKTQQHFATAFRKRYHLVPSDYRKRFVS